MWYDRETDIGLHPAKSTIGTHRRAQLLVPVKSNIVGTIPCAFLGLSVIYSNPEGLSSTRHVLSKHFYIKV